MRRHSRQRLAVKVSVLCCALLALGTAVFAAAAEPEAVDYPLLAVTENTFLGAGPVQTPGQLEGVDLVIDLRYPYEGVYDELGTLRSHGIRSENIPVSSRGPTLRQVEQLSELLARSAGDRVLIHDSNGQRTALLWSAYRLWEGTPFETAVSEAAPLHDTAALRSALARFQASLPP